MFPVHTFPQHVDFLSLAQHDHFPGYVHYHGNVQAESGVPGFDWLENTWNGNHRS